ncbi:MAG TPA: HRDC domain-containing protein [Gemmatimonadales bacterium]
MSRFAPITPTLVTDNTALRALAERLGRARRVALDTEAASFHRYVDRVYLIQASVDDESALIDPLLVDDLAPIGRILADPALEVIFHDADYDLRILHRDYGFVGRRIWDTRVAAQLCGEQSFGLSALLEKHFGVRLSKQLQRADWSERPLTAAMIAYAAADTAYLPALRDRLADQLAALGRTHWASEEFLRLEAVRWSPRAEEGEEFLAMKGAKALRPPQLAVLQALWEWRNARSRELDRAPFRVLGNDVLLALAREAPETADAMRRVHGVPESIARRHGPELLEVIKAARATPEAQWPRVVRRPRERPDPALEERVARLKALRTERATAIGLDPGLIGPNGTLAAIARVQPRAAADLDRVPDLRRWQREILGDAAVLAAVA